MRALRISHSAAVDEWRGRERALGALEVDVLLLSGRRTDAGGAMVVLEPRPGEQVEPVGMLGQHPALFLYDPRPIWRALGEKWDVLDLHEEPFALATAEILVLRALRRQRAPVVLYTAQNLDKRYPIPFRWLERWALRTAAGVSACNSEAARIVERKGFAGRARVIPLGIDGGRFSPVDSAQGTGGAGSPDDAASLVTVGLLGRLVPEKGVDVLLRAVSRDLRLRARIAGSGPLAGSLQARCSELGIADRVELLGPIPPDEVEGFYRTLDVLAVPSIPTSRWTEQFGRVAVEAMACGIPVVASAAGALPDVVGGAGILVPPGDAASLAGALVEAGGPRRAELEELGLRRAAECSWDSVARDYLALYRSVVHTESAPDDRGVEIVIVAYGAPDMLREAIAPVVGLPVTVVDNSSLAEIAALCSELGVRYIDAGRNAGFGAGVNIALADRLVTGADVLLLNPDAVISPDQIRVLHRGLRAEPDLATVGPVQVDESGEPAQVAWPFPHPLASWREALGLGQRSRGAHFVIGSVLLLRAEALEQVGGFDERFFLYAEETDWAYRAHRLGWRHGVVAGARAVHHGAGTSVDSLRREAHFHASQERYLRKHFGALGWQSARTAVWIGAMLRSIVLPGARGTAARRRAALYRLGPDPGRAPPRRRSGYVMRIVQIAPFIGGGSGLAGVAWNLDQQFRDLGAQVETFTFVMARRGLGGPGPRRPLARRIARAWRTVWFSTVGTVRARRFLAERPDAFSICHDDVLAGDIYVSHGVLAASMKARGQSTWRTVRRPMHVFAYLRDLYRFRSRTHRTVVALSTAEETALRDTYGRIHPPVVVIPNGVDLEQFRPPTPDERVSARDTFRLDVDARVAIFVGHEFERKGLAFAIEGLLHAPTVMLLVVGGTAEIIDEARAQAESLGVAERVLLVGPRYDLPLFFAASDMFVLPSAYESNALVVLEALASGLPVVATPVGFAPEIIEDGVNGFLVARDAREVGERLEQIADEDLDAWRQRARASAEPYAWRRIAAQYIELAERLRPDLVKP